MGLPFQVNKYVAYLLVASFPAAEAFLARGAQSPAITETIHIFSRDAIADDAVRQMPIHYNSIGIRNAGTLHRIHF